MAFGPLSSSGAQTGREQRAEQRPVIVMGRFVAARMKPASTLLLVEIPVEIGGGEPHLHVGIAALEIMQPRDQPLERHRHIDLDGQFIVGAAASGCGSAFRSGRRHRAWREIDVAGLGQLGAPGIAAEKLKAQVLLQRLDLVAHGRAGDARARPPQAGNCQAWLRLRKRSAHVRAGGRVGPNDFTNGMCQPT